MNYAMFDPVYQILRHDPEIKVRISSGQYRRRFWYWWISPRDPEALNEKLYAEFDIDPAHLIKTSLHDTRPWDVYVTSNMSLRIQPQRVATTVQIFHGVSFRNFAVNAKYKRFDKLFFIGRYHLDKYIEAKILKPNDPKAELMGMPKLDRLVDGSVKREEVLRGFGLDPDLPTILWCPTGARHNSFERLGEAGLRAAQSHGHNFIIKLHDHPHLGDGLTEEGIRQTAERGLGERGRLATHSDVAPLLVAADLLISDASSVAYEFTLRDKPIIFVDVPELLQHRAGMEDSKMDMNTHGRRMGRIVSTADELRTAIAEELADPGRLSPERRAAAEHIFHQPGTAAKRMAQRLKELAFEAQRKREGG